MKTFFSRHASLLFSMVFFSLALLSSCVRHDENLLVRMEEIKELGNHNPQLAMQKLDSLQNEMDNADAYILNKYSLLSIRLQDKAYILAKSDTPIMRLVRYFESHGSTAERQEAYYYAGSAYRDLQDTPKALEYFLKSADCCEGREGIDSVMLRNTYSQLGRLYYYVQDYSNALAMSRKEIDIAKKLNILNALTLVAEGAALHHLDSLSAALEPFENALDYIERNQSYEKNQQELVSLLYYFIQYRKMDKAEKCYQLIQSNEKFPVLQDLYFNIGCYLMMCGKTDSSLVYFNKALDEGPNLIDRQSASKFLLKYYNYVGDKEQANRYAMQYLHWTDTLNYRVRQEEAATTNNRYKYFKNREEELLLQEEKNKYRMLLIVVSAVALVLLFALASFFLFRRNKRLRELLEKTRELKSTKEENRRMQTELIQQKEELEGLGKKIRENCDELVRMKEELDKSETELTRAREEVASRMEQSRQFLQMLQRTQFEERAHDVIQQIQEASEGRHTMTPDDWKKFHSAVNLLYPDLNDKIVEHLGERITEQQLRICHLMRIGMTNPQIERLTDIPKVTVWRWVKKYEWVLE